MRTDASDAPVEQIRFEAAGDMPVPSLSVQVRGTGKRTYEGEGYVAAKGTHEFTTAADQSVR